MSCGNTLPLPALAFILTPCRHSIPNNVSATPSGADLTQPDDHGTGIGAPATVLDAASRARGTAAPLRGQ
ncbi:uncharacterized protein SCHCODRAFT_02628367 [Schizophyllum commune H4-8]|uniref:uncharacterized protein n=1 Tax=Schizophyllum commune (strain H4-8 / FGSC 9210) TaxID=578458 RepID=UPI00215F7EE7|nr:uncharacterized protein SCHCODRAFT_02628367 [Schizophyllum commune H4-8]KAI5891192.1 hypothetical protein SCHCODRAFT_02628367 [Schizophyllum commune H4-8]